MNPQVFQADMNALQSIRDMQELQATFAKNEMELTGHTIEAGAVMVSIVNTAVEMVAYIDRVIEAMVERATEDIGIDLSFLGEDEPED